MTAGCPTTPFTEALAGCRHLHLLPPCCGAISGVTWCCLLPCLPVCWAHPAAGLTGTARCCRCRSRHPTLLLVLLKHLWLLRLPGMLLLLLLLPLLLLSLRPGLLPLLLPGLLPCCCCCPWAG